MPSPFHGIFSALQQQETGAAAPSAHVDSAQGTVTMTTKKTQPMHGGQIAVDIYELDNYTIIRAPIPGVKLSDLDIEVDGQTLTIKGRRTSGDAIPDEQFLLQECFWGEFSRSVTLPSMIDPKKIKATFSKDCILKILIPKEEKVKIVRISEGG